MPSGFNPGSSALRRLSRVTWGVGGREAENMKDRLDTGLIGCARRVLVIGVPAVGLALAMVSVVPGQQAFAQETDGGSINIGGTISATVADAVSDIATGSGGSTTTIGGISVEHSELEFGEDESTAISDASGGNGNVSEKRGSRDK
jgi:hypothetical protein